MQDKDVHIGDYLWLCFDGSNREFGYYRIVLTQVHVTGHLPPGTKKCYKVEKACALSEYGAEHIMYHMGMGKGEFYTATADELYATEYDALIHASDLLREKAVVFKHRADEIPKGWRNGRPIN